MPRNRNTAGVGLEVVEVEAPFRDFSAGRFFALVGGYWRGATRARARWLTIALVVSVLVNIALQYALNLWNKSFFDAIGVKDLDKVSHAVGLFVVLAGLIIAAAAIQTFFRMTMAATWRRWLTDYLAGEWLRDRQFYKLHIAAPEVDSPEFRMTDDVRQAIDPLVDFAIGILNAVLMASVFAVVLFQVGGGITVLGLSVPGYFVLAAAVYGVLASLVTFMIGKPLVQSTEQKNAAEAKSRFELVRIRENAESIAMIDGAEDEKANIQHTLREVLARWRVVIRQQSFVTLIIQGNAVLSPVIPLLIGAPKYLAGDLSLGELMQISAAFLQVQMAFNWLVENFFRLAEWTASARRILELSLTLHTFSETDAARTEIEVKESADARIHLIDLSVAQHNGATMIRNADFVIEPGEKILIKGESGTGKSTLIRAIAGLWPWGKGTIQLPPDARVMFVPQRPYIPNGTLRDALIYPESGPARSDDEIAAALRRGGLRHLAEDLDREERWDKLLSGGEQQRLAFARLVLHRPEIIVLDEATSALDEGSQDDLMGLFLNELSAATVLSVGHRPGLEHFHDRIIELKRRPMGAQVSENSDTAGRIAGLLRELMRSTPAEPTGGVTPDSNAQR